MSLGRDIGNYVVGPLLEVVDVDGVLRSVDVNDIVERIDIQQLVDRIDFNKVLDQVNLNLLLDRVDMERMVHRANLEKIIARSSSSIFDVAWFALRTFLVQADQLVQSMGGCQCRRKVQYLPPRPGRSKKQKNRIRPRDPSSLAVAIQGCYAGAFLQLMAWFLDELIILLMVTIAALFVNMIVRAIVDDPDWSFVGWKFYALVFALWSYCYHVVLLAVIGRTIGKATCGLLLVNAGNGQSVSFLRVALRTLVELAVTVTIVGLAVQWVRRDGRGIADLVAYTGVVYSWDARMGRLKTQTTTQPMCESDFSWDEEELDP